MPAVQVCTFAFVQQYVTKAPSTHDPEKDTAGSENGWMDQNAKDIQQGTQSCIM